MRLVFWNCGVAPPKGKRSEKRAEAVARVVNEIVRRRPAIIALCEADAAVVDDLTSALELRKHDYRERILNDSIGKSCWDLVLLFDRRQVEVRKKSPITVLNGGVHLRAAYPLKVEALNAHLRFELFLAHWPSRLSGTSADNRKLCASALRNAIAKRLRESDRVVVLGDFNEEPHDMVICNDLRASRDPEVVIRKPGDRLYNPSWWLASPAFGNSWEDFGTMRYENSQLGTRWHALDQALTCHQWLDRENGWAPELRALRPPIAAASLQRVFDHVPIELTLTR